MSGPTSDKDSRVAVDGSRGWCVALAAFMATALAWTCTSFGSTPDRIGSARRAAVGVAVPGVVRGEGVAAVVDTTRDPPPSPQSSEHRSAIAATVVEKGRTAGLRGLVHCRGGGIPATVEFVAGPNKGRVVECAADGTLSRVDLYPGFGLLEVRHGAEWIRRELRLRPGRATDLAIEFGDFGAITGTVVDAAGSPVAGASVLLDGEETRTDARGAFSLRQRAAGAALLVVHAPGHAAHRQLATSRDRAQPLTIALQPGCELDVSLLAAPGPSPALVYVFPVGIGPRTAGGAQSGFPWHRVHPIPVAAGGARSLVELPAGEVEVHVFHARCHASRQRAWLVPGEPAQLHFALEQAPTLRGWVTSGGLPIAGAAVAVHFEDCMRATVAELGDAGDRLWSQPIEILPHARQVVRTDAAGRFVVGAGASDGVRYISVEVPSARDAYVTRWTPADGPSVEIEVPAP